MLKTAAMLALSALGAIALAADPATKPASGYPLSTCTVSGEALPTDGSVVVRTIDDREVHFCCDKCVTDFEADREASHKKLDEQIIEAGKPAYSLATCIVSDDELNSMGEPVYYVHRPTNQLVAFCCKGCVKPFKADPAKYLLKIDPASR